MCTPQATPAAQHQHEHRRRGGHVQVREAIYTRCPAPMQLQAPHTRSDTAGSTHALRHSRLHTRTQMQQAPHTRSDAAGSTYVLRHSRLHMPDSTSCRLSRPAPAARHLPYQASKQTYRSAQACTGRTFMSSLARARTQHYMCARAHINTQAAWRRKAQAGVCTLALRFSGLRSRIHMPAIRNSIISLLSLSISSAEYMASSDGSSAPAIVLRYITPMAAACAAPCAHKDRGCACLCLVGPWSCGQQPLPLTPHTCTCVPRHGAGR